MENGISSSGNGAASSSAHGDMKKHKSSSKSKRHIENKKSSTVVESEGRMVMLDKPMGACARAFLNLFVLLTEIVLLGVLTVTLFWVFHYEGGVAWTNDIKRQFNLHFILMIVGLIFLNGQAILTYRLFGCCRRIYAKLTHAFLFLSAASCVAIGFYVAFEANERVHKGAHFYSLHSWLAIVTCGLFIMQLLVGLVSFLILLCCDGATASFRAALVPVHATFGLIIFVLGSATTLTGFMQAARARLNGQNQNADYRDYPEQGWILNALSGGVALLIILLPLVARNNIRGGRAVFTTSGSVAAVDMS
ncbi:cytochrome b561-like isoform X1 [Varroa destructor]|uniref:Cytochrome b561 domain-containing protein n=1 Tax=Varroa destructor TaxID=109461 RepID=A0A7M7KD81_VARDE|nr:cytochrome b561-like isoform X1 [Varroa destructor]XP_022659302.1 cytochrome b561-like isoform X1 [Varroa destructor]